MKIHSTVVLDVSENLGSDEESGKSWSELEEEARRGKSKTIDLRFVEFSHC